MAISTMTHFKSLGELWDAVAKGRKIFIVPNYRGHEEGVHHDETCPHFGTRRAGEDKEYTPECPVNEETFSATGRCQLFAPLYMERTYEGLVLETRERNYYDDSDFYAIVWDIENQKPKTIEYATTRAWTYPNSARIDAPEEIRKAFEDYERAYVRRVVISGAWRQRCEDVELARECRLDNYHVLRRLRFSAPTRDAGDRLIKLLKSRAKNRLRSDFRKSLAAQVYAWIMNPEPAHRSPLSRRQWEYL